ncbi:MAG: HigA family addiction module antitoxin [Pseudomonadota bacterium]
MKATDTVESPLAGLEPPRPGDFVKADILDLHNLSQTELAKRLGLSRRSVNQIVLGQRAVTLLVARRLGKLTGTSAKMWLNLQMQHDLWRAEKEADEFVVQPLDS